MKKMTAGVFAAAMIATTIAGTTSAADAAPYPGSVDTGCAGYVVGYPHKGHDVNVRVEVSAKESTGSEPKGWIDVKVEKLNGADGSSARYFTRGGAVVLNVGQLKPGRYVGSADFDSRPKSSKFTDCHASFTFRVHREGR